MIISLLDINQGVIMDNVNIVDQTDGYVPFTEEQLKLMQTRVIAEKGECMPVWLEFLHKSIKKCRLKDIIYRANNNLGDEVSRLVSDRDYYWHFDATDKQRVDRLRKWWGKGIPDTIIIDTFNFWTEQEIYERLEDWNIEEDSNRYRDDSLPREGKTFTIQQEKWIANIYYNTSRDAQPYWKEGKGPTQQSMIKIIKTIYGIDAHLNTIKSIVKRFKP